MTSLHVAYFQEIGKILILLCWCTKLKLVAIKFFMHILVPVVRNQLTSECFFLILYTCSIIPMLK